MRVPDDTARSTGTAGESAVEGGGRRRVTLGMLVGSGHKIMLFTLPFLVIGLVIAIGYPSVLDFGDPPAALRAVSVVVLAAGVAIWAWSVALILTRVPRGELITTGPYGWVRHPIYTSVALLVLPWLGLLFGSWLGALVGIGMYLGSRRYAPEEEAALAKEFGPAWDHYRDAVRIPWL